MIPRLVFIALAVALAGLIIKSFTGEKGSRYKPPPPKEIEQEEQEEEEEEQKENPPPQTVCACGDTAVSDTLCHVTDVNVLVWLNSKPTETINGVVGVNANCPTPEAGLFFAPEGQWVYNSDRAQAVQNLYEQCNLANPAACPQSLNCPLGWTLKNNNGKVATCTAPSSYSGPCSHTSYFSLPLDNRAKRDWAIPCRAEFPGADTCAEGDAVLTAEEVREYRSVAEAEGKHPHVGSMCRVARQPTLDALKWFANNRSKTVEEMNSAAGTTCSGNVGSSQGWKVMQEVDGKWLYPANMTADVEALYTDCK